MKVYVFKENNKINIHFKNFPGKTYHYLRLRGEKIKDVVGGKEQLITYDGDTILYLLEANKNKILIILE